MTNDQIAASVIDQLFADSGLPKTEQAAIRRTLFEGDAPEQWDFASLAALACYLGMRALGLIPEKAANLFGALAPLARALNDPVRRAGIDPTWIYNPLTSSLAPAGSELTSSARFGVIVLPLGLYVRRLEQQVVRLQTGAAKAMLN